MKKNIKSAKFFLFALSLSLIGCKDNQESKTEDTSTQKTMAEGPFFKISLAQWSLHKAINDDKTLNPLDFAEKAKSLGFDGVEYVTQLYNEQIKEMGIDAVIDTLNVRSKKHGVDNILIMIDGEGDLAAPEEKERNEAVEKHKKWVDAASKLGCHAVRVNLFGTRDPDIWLDASADGLLKLSQYAATKNINVLVENHGYLSSNADLVKLVMMKLEMANCGTLPDFGNFCLEREGGAMWGTKCIKEYDKYIGVDKLMPWAKAVSAKSHNFDENGNETNIDYVKMLKIVKRAGYTGYIGIEYEGDVLGEEEGIEATKNLLISAAKRLK